MKLTAEQIKTIEGLGDLGRDRPKELWVRGNWTEVLNQPMAAVVGSRRMTSYGRRVTQMLVPELVEMGKVVVSGLMYGVDRLAHEETIRCGGKTVAVLGWGINQRLETSDQELVEKIVGTGGVVMSEWENQVGALWTFPRRNRIVAAISQQVYVVEAGKKSGSLITAGWAGKLGREIWAVPGPVTSAVSQGANELLASGRAKMWMPGLGTRSQELGNSDTKDSEIYTLLQNDMLTVDELVVMTGKPVAEISQGLMQLQLAGQIEEMQGKYYPKG